MISQEAKDFIKNNYPNRGSMFCAEKLNMKHKNVNLIAHRMGITINREKFTNPNRYRKNKINVNEFKKHINKYSAYILGFIWADGFLYNYNNHYEIGIEITSKDAEKILSIFLKTGEWCSYSITSPSKKKWQPQTKIHCNCKELFKILEENDYTKKSNVVGPNKILTLIPKEFHNYFFRGLSDGDGCFYFNKKRFLRQYSISSTYNQDWGFFIDLLEILSIQKYNYIQRQIFNKKTCKLNSHSLIRITNKEDIKKLGEYLYSGEFFGLKRKYDTFNHIKE